MSRLVRLAHCRVKPVRVIAQRLLWLRKRRLLYEVLATGTVRDLERLERCYADAQLPEMVALLKLMTNGDYPSFVLKRDSDVWANQ